MFSPPIARPKEKTAERAEAKGAALYTTLQPSQSAQRREYAKPQAALTGTPSSWTLSNFSIFPAGLQQHRKPDAAAPRLPGNLQRKLIVGRVDDPLELEADRIADQLMRPQSSAQPSQFNPSAGLRKLSRKCSCAACQEDEEVMRQAIAPQTLDGQQAPALVNEVLSQSGRPLDLESRDFFEGRLGIDLGHIRVHDDNQAARSARAVAARGYAVGDHVVLAEQGRQLLAHELAHTVQQSRRGIERRIARKPLSLETLNPGVLSDVDLAAKINELRAWFANNSSSNEKGLHFANALAKAAWLLTARLPSATLPKGTKRSPESLRPDDVVRANTAAGAGPAAMGPVAGFVAPVPPAIVSPAPPSLAPPTPAPFTPEPAPLPAPAPAPAPTPAPAVAPEPAPASPLAFVTPAVAGAAAFALVFLWDDAPMIDEGAELRRFDQRNAERNAEWRAAHPTPAPAPAPTPAPAPAPSPASTAATVPAAPTAAIPAAPSPKAGPTSKQDRKKNKKKEKKDCQLTYRGVARGDDPLATLFCSHVSRGGPSYDIWSRVGTAEIDALRGRTWYECKCGHRSLIEAYEGGEQWAISHFEGSKEPDAPLAKEGSKKSKKDTKKPKKQKRFKPGQDEQLVRHVRIAAHCGYNYILVVASEEVAEFFRNRYTGVHVEVVEFDPCE